MIIQEKNYFIKELSPEIITVPPNIEAVWALLTPKSAGTNSSIRHIAVCAYYYTEKTKRSEFVDHISETYNILCAKYGSGLHFIFSGDTNRLNLKSILNLSPRLKQVVTVPTRLNPDAILDTIITTLWAFYQLPFTLAPLDNDTEKNGKPSDHQIVIWKPINASEPQVRKTKEITFRPLPESGITQFGEWLKTENWDVLFNAQNANQKANKKFNFFWRISCPRKR